MRRYLRERVVLLHELVHRVFEGLRQAEQVINSSKTDVVVMDDACSLDRSMIPRQLAFAAENGRQKRAGIAAEEVGWPPASLLAFT